MQRHATYSRKNIEAALKKVYKNREQGDHARIPFLDKEREKSYKLLCKKGLPTQKSEAYRYTPLIKTITSHFLENLSPPPHTPTANIPPLPSLLHGIKGYTLTFINGYLVEQGSNLPFVCQPLGEAYSDFKNLIDGHFNAQVEDYQDAWANANTACHKTPYLLYIPSDTRLTQPIILHHHTAAHKPITTYPRLLIIVGLRAQATIIDTATTPHLAPPSFVNHVSELVLQPSSNLTYYPLHINHSPTHQLRHTYIHQSTKTKFTNHFIATSTNDALLRESTHITLQGSHADNALYGLYRNQHKKHLAIHTTTTHKNAHTTTKQVYKGTADDQATTIFHGNIHIPPQQHHIIASQYHKGWILSPQASIHTRPELAIKADDVQCSHGATTTQLDPTMLNYMQTRGIPPQKAKNILLDAFFQEAINIIPNQDIQDLIAQTLLGHHKK